MGIVKNADHHGRKPRVAAVRAHRVAIEITSPTTGHVDRGIKERTRGRSEQPEVLDRTLEWHFEGASEPFVLDLQAFFAEVHDIFEGESFTSR